MWGKKVANLLPHWIKTSSKLGSIMSARQVRLLTVNAKTQLTPNMIRIQLQGEALSDFPDGAEGGYIKLLFQDPTDLDANGEGKTRMRSYTVRYFDKEALTLDLDFVAHGDNGPASAWALSCVIGDQVSLIGPGVVKLPDTHSDWFFLVGDMTALPALSVIAERLPQDAKGYLVVELLSLEDKPNLDLPEGVELVCVINPDQENVNTLLVDKVVTLPWLEGEGFIWSACEMSSMRLLRDYFLKEKKVSKDHIYISSYWKMGVSDEGHKLAKKQDAVGN